MENLILFLFTFYCMFTISYAGQAVRYDFGTNQNLSRLVHDNLIVHINSIKEHSLSLVLDANPMRFMYEESEEYEQGYVFSEIMERTREMVAMVEMSMSPFSTLFDLLKHTEVTQKNFFELFELVSMFHEIPYKYWEEPAIAPEHTSKERDKREASKAEESRIFLDYYSKEYKDFLKKRLDQRKKRQKMLRNINMSLKKFSLDTKVQRRPNKSRHWPIEYGWEIDYDW